MAVAPVEVDCLFGETGPGGPITGLAGTLIGPDGTFGDVARLLDDADSRGLEHADGAFAAFRYDPSTHELRLASDKFGMRPLFIASAGDLVAFCSEFPPLLLLPDLDKALDHDAIAEYFSLGSTLGARTLFRHIRNLAPGTILSLRGDNRREHRYWVPRIGIDHGDGIERAAEVLATTMVTVVRDLVDHGPGKVCLLSAGADSRLILSCLRDDQRQSLRFLTSKISMLRAEDDRDVIGATELARALGLKHDVLDIAYADLQFGPDYFDRERHMRPSELLGGWHGGEILGGCCHDASPIEPGLARATVDARLSAVFSPEFLIGLNQHPWETYQSRRSSLVAENQDFLAQIELMSRAFFAHVYGGSQGHWLQPFQIIHHGHSPFWDSRFLTAILKVPFVLVRDYGLYNVIFRDHLPALRHVPSNSMLTRRADSALAPMTAGQEPKILQKIRPRQLDALERMAISDSIRQRGDYAPAALTDFLRDAGNAASLKFVDFEAWRTRYVDSAS